MRVAWKVRPVAACTIAIVLATSGVALGQPRTGKPAAASQPATLPADVETAEQLYAKLDYEQANAIAERVVKKNGLSHDQLVRAYRILAVTYAVLDREELAKDAFLQLLVYDPEYQADPNLGPKVNTPFVEARGTFRGYTTKPRVEVAPSVTRSGGTLRVTTKDPTHVVKKVSVGYRWTSNGDFVVTQVAAGDGVAVEVQPAPAGRTRLDYYAQALDERDNAVLEAGNAQVPKSAFAEGSSVVDPGPKKESGSIFGSPIFWIVAGAAVVGGGAALFFATRPQDPPTRASLSPVILCGTERCN